MDEQAASGYWDGCSDDTGSLLTRDGFAFGSESLPSQRSAIYVRRRFLSVEFAWHGTHFCRCALLRPHVQIGVVCTEEFGRIETRRARNEREHNGFTVWLRLVPTTA